jgi:hypothetical protein
MHKALENEREKEGRQREESREKLLVVSSSRKVNESSNRVGCVYVRVTVFVDRSLSPPPLVYNCTNTSAASSLVSAAFFYVHIR